MVSTCTNDGPKRWSSRLSFQNEISVANLDHLSHKWGSGNFVADSVLESRVGKSLQESWRHFNFILISCSVEKRFSMWKMLLQYFKENMHRRQIHYSPSCPSKQKNWKNKRTCEAWLDWKVAPDLKDRSVLRQDGVHIPISLAIFEWALYSSRRWLPPHRSRVFAAKKHFPTL